MSLIYVGHARGTGRPLDAVFAHVLSIREGRVVSLEQITDPSAGTRPWLQDRRSSWAVVNTPC